MEHNITACPSCGALGEVGKKCPFCNTTITAPDDMTKISSSKIVSVQTVSPELFAEKISKYQGVDKFFCDQARVRIGSLYGIINRNGDLVIPVRYSFVGWGDKDWFILPVEDKTRTYRIYSLEKGGFYPFSFQTIKDSFSWSKKNGVDGQIVLEIESRKEVEKIPPSYKSYKGRELLEQLASQGAVTPYLEEYSIKYSIVIDSETKEKVFETPGGLKVIAGLYQCYYSYPRSDRNSFSEQTKFHKYFTVKPRVFRNMFYYPDGKKVLENNNLSVEEKGYNTNVFRLVYHYLYHDSFYEYEFPNTFAIDSNASIEQQTKGLISFIISGANQFDNKDADLDIADTNTKKQIDALKSGIETRVGEKDKKSESKGNKTDSVKAEPEKPFSVFDLFRRKRNL